MMDSMAILLLAVYYATLGILAVYGLHRLFLLALLCRNRRRRQTPNQDPDAWPRVTVQLPLYNEMYVAPRLLEAACRLDYPSDRLEIQILDDSTDETTAIMADLAARYRERGINVRHLHRTHRAGFKAGALEAGLGQAQGDLVAVFDADFVPPPQFLRATVPHFSDPEVGMVQARWDHINRNFSWLTRVQAILLDGHFLIEHAARHWSGRFFNFNGTAGIWRRQAIEQAGGWQHDTLTEDLDLSYRAQLEGWRFLYLPEVVVPAELPVDVDALKSQQHRWAKGSVQTGRKILGRILHSSYPWWVKLEAVVHLTNNACYLLIVVLSLLVFPAMLLRRGSEVWKLLAIDLPLFLTATVSVLTYYVASQGFAGRRWWKELRHLPGVMSLGIGLCLNNARAVLSGLVHMGGTFNRTPKYRIESPGEGWRNKRYRTGPNLSVLMEGALALYFAGAVLWAVKLEMWLSIPFLYLFLQGFTYMSLLSIPRLQGRRALSAGTPD